MENKIIVEMLKKAATPEELKKMASENGIEISDEEAGICYARLHRSGELSDDEIDNVAGGGCGSRIFYCMDFDGKYEPKIGRTCAVCNNYSVADGNCKLGYSMEN